MFKLLPAVQKEKVETEYKQRRLTVFLLMLSLLVLCTMAGLFPTFISTAAKKSALALRLAELGAVPVPQGSVALKAWAQNVKKELVFLSAKNDIAKPYELFVKVLDLHAKGIRINGFSWGGISKGKSKSPINLSIAGAADNRQSLIAFEQALSASKVFATTTFPISDLAGDTNIPFTFNLTPAQ